MLMIAALLKVGECAHTRRSRCFQTEDSSRPHASRYSANA